MNRWKIGGVCLALGGVLSSNAQAEPSPQEKAASEALFNEAVKLTLVGNHAEACPKFEASHKLDKTTNTTIRLADCDEKIGKLATAYGLFLDAAGELKRAKDKREPAVRARADDLQQRLFYAKVQVPPEMAALPSFTVTCNDTPMVRAQWGQSVPVDPGKPTFKAIADGYKEWTQGFDLLEKTNLIVDVPMLEPVVQPPPPPPKGGSGQKIAAFVAGGVGIVALGIGGFFGVRTFSQWDDALSHCENGNKARCDNTGITAGAKADTSATIANVAIGVGIAGLAGGVILYLTAPSSNAPKVGQRVSVFPAISSSYQGGSVLIRF